MIDIKKLAKETTPSDKAKALVGAEVGFEIAGAELYPATIDEIQACLGVGKGPAKFADTEGTPNALHQYWTEAQRLGTGAFELARMRYDQCGGLSPEQKKARNAALECARKWFTEVLHQSVGGQPMGLHITGKEFKLC